LDDEDIKNGYNDYIYYSVYERANGVDYEQRDNCGGDDDGGEILMKELYESHTTLEIAVKVIAFNFQDMEEKEIYQSIYSHEIKISHEAPKEHLERFNAEAKAKSELEKLPTLELIRLYNKTDYTDCVKTTDELAKDKEENPGYADQIDETLKAGKPYAAYNECYDDFRPMDEKEAREFLIESLYEERADKLERRSIK